METRPEIKELKRHYHDAKDSILKIQYLYPNEELELEDIEEMVLKLQTLTRDLMELANKKYNK